MSAASAPPPGIYVPVPTFFQPSTAAFPQSSFKLSTAPLDTRTQIQHSLHLARSGIRGLVLLGSTGEAVHLTRSERSEVITSVRKALSEKGFENYPLIAGTATNSIVETIELLQDAKNDGADYGMVLAPNYFAGALNHKTGLDGIEAWFKAVADASPIPILIYHYPAVSNQIRIPASTLVSLAQHPNIVGTKLSHGDISTYIQVSLNPEVSSDGFGVYTGLGQQLLPVLTIGCAGAIDGLAGIFPKTLVQLYNECVKGDIASAKKLQFVVSSAEELVVKWGTVGIKEGIKKHLKMGDGAGGRLPLSIELPKGEWASWEGIMGKMQKIEDSLAAGKSLNEMNGDI